ncbi:MAG: hypothetical protein AUI11_07570 [Acidobacteria bacterium 13_2_20CM_2_66_4]|nr:MAG: hypothetical protein AUI11_07570 [Acidobacteria bacterium 13_2_20CM_2_66_4]
MRTPALAACAALTIFTAIASLYGDGTPSSRPGAVGGGVTLLPNGWKIAPAGRHVTVGHLPLAMVESPDGRSLMVATNGYDGPPSPLSIPISCTSARRCCSITPGSGWRGTRTASGCTSRAPPTARSTSCAGTKVS